MFIHAGVFLHYMGMLFRRNYLGLSCNFQGSWQKFSYSKIANKTGEIPYSCHIQGWGFPLKFRFVPYMNTLPYA